MMSDKKLIDSLYKRYHRRPDTLDERHLYLLVDFIVDEQGVELNDDRIVFTGIDEHSPFREIRLNNINGVEDLGGWLAIVLHSTIIFFNKDTHEVSVHIRPISLRDRLSSILSLH